MNSTFNLSVSTQSYKDKGLIKWNQVKFEQRHLTLFEVIDVIKRGYIFCHSFNVTENPFSICEKTKTNFKSADMVFIDVDDSEIPMTDFVERLTDKPTLAYTTHSNYTAKSQYLYRFRLIYGFAEPITSTSHYEQLYDSIIEGIKHDMPTFDCKDNCGRLVSQNMYGNPKENCETICTEHIFSLSEFPFKNNNVSVCSSILSLNGKSEDVKDIQSEPTITDTEFIRDVYCMTTVELIEKYSSKYPYFDRTPLHFENGYAIIPENYNEIYRSWYIDTFEKNNGDVVNVARVKKKRDGQRRRKTLFIAGLVMKSILPSITVEHLLFNLIKERSFYYDNSDGQLSNDVLFGIAKRVVATPIDEIRLKSRNKKRFVVDKLYCAEHGISPNTMKQIVRKKLKDEEIGNLYNQSLSITENLRIFKQMGVKVGKSKLYTWCNENGIATKRKKKASDNECYCVYNTIEELTSTLISYFNTTRHKDKTILKERIAELVAELVA